VLSLSAPGRELISPLSGHPMAHRVSESGSGAPAISLWTARGAKVVVLPYSEPRLVDYVAFP
jgi:hypothetical protein